MRFQSLSRIARLIAINPLEIMRIFTGRRIFNAGCVCGLVKSLMGEGFAELFFYFEVFFFPVKEGLLLLM